MLLVRRSQAQLQPPQQTGVSSWVVPSWAAPSWVASLELQGLLQPAANPTTSKQILFCFGFFKLLAAIIEINRLDAVAERRISVKSKKELDFSLSRLSAYPDNQ